MFCGLRKTNKIDRSFCNNEPHYYAENDVQDARWASIILFLLPTASARCELS